MMATSPRVLQVEVVDEADCVVCERDGCSRPARYRLDFDDGGRLALCPAHAAGAKDS